MGSSSCYLNPSGRDPPNDPKKALKKKKKKKKLGKESKKAMYYDSNDPAFWKRQNYRGSKRSMIARGWGENRQNPEDS